MKPQPSAESSPKASLAEYCEAFLQGQGSRSVTLPGAGRRIEITDQTLSSGDLRGGSFVIRVTNTEDGSTTLNAQIYSNSESVQGSDDSDRLDDIMALVKHFCTKKAAKPERPLVYDLLENRLRLICILQHVEKYLKELEEGRPYEPADEIPVLEKILGSPAGESFENISFLLQQGADLEFIIALSERLRILKSYSAV